MKTIQTSTPPDLGGLFELPDPVLSAYLGRVPPMHEYGVADHHGTILRATDHGAPSVVVDVLKQIIEAAPAGAESAAVFIGADGTSTLFPMPGARIGDHVVRSPVPHLTPLLAWWQAHPAHVVAVLDR